jgi:malate/lactate dehydrogenase
LELSSIGRKGVEKILEYKLDEAESELEKSAEAVRQNKRSDVETDKI